MNKRHAMFLLFFFDPAKTPRVTLTNFVEHWPLCHMTSKRRESIHSFSLFSLLSFAHISLRLRLSPLPTYFYLSDRHFFFVSFRFVSSSAVASVPLRLSFGHRHKVFFQFHFVETIDTQRIFFFFVSFRLLKNAKRMTTTTTTTVKAASPSTKIIIDTTTIDDLTHLTDDRDKTFVIILAVTLPTLALIGILILLFICYRRRHATIWLKKIGKKTIRLIPIDRISLSEHSSRLQAIVVNLSSTPLQAE